MNKHQVSVSSMFVCSTEGCFSDQVEDGQAWAPDCWTCRKHFNIEFQTTTACKFNWPDEWRLQIHDYKKIQFWIHQPGKFSALPCASTYGWAGVTAFERFNYGKDNIILEMMRRIAVIMTELLYLDVWVVMWWGLNNENLILPFRCFLWRVERKKHCHCL